MWVQHSDDGLVEGSPGWDLVPELIPEEGEALVRKKFGDSFEATDLEEVLAAPASGALSSSAPRPTPASAPPSTARSPAATT